MAKKKKPKISKTLRQKLFNACIQISESLIGGPTLMSPTFVNSFNNPVKQSFQKITSQNNSTYGNCSVPNNMVSVQPMTPPVGKLFYMDTYMMNIDDDEMMMQNELNGTSKIEDDESEKISTFDL